jgi:hypothetical protein
MCKGCFMPREYPPHILLPAIAQAYQLQQVRDAVLRHAGIHETQDEE